MLKRLSGTHILNRGGWAQVDGSSAELPTSSMGSLRGVIFISHWTQHEKGSLWHASPGFHTGTGRIPNCPSEFKEELYFKLWFFLQSAASFEHLEIHFLKITSSASILSVFYFFKIYYFILNCVCMCICVWVRAYEYRCPRWISWNRSPRQLGATWRGCWDPNFGSLKALHIPNLGTIFPAVMGAFQRLHFDIVSEVVQVRPFLETSAFSRAALAAHSSASHLGLPWLRCSCSQSFLLLFTCQVQSWY